jgi:hypothetical protein
MTQVMEYVSRLNKMVFEKCGFQVSNLLLEKESVKYHACSFTINNQKVVYRKSKITPTKTGQFVTLWKRNKHGVTQPFDIDDPIDLVIINTQLDQNFGQFVFPRSVLMDKGIFSTKTKEGKRGFRIYPPWDKTSNKQAIKTQKWQLEYFVSNTTPIDINRVKVLYLQE